MKLVASLFIKLTLPFLVLLNGKLIAQIILPQLQAGVYTDTIITTSSWQFTGYCLPGHDVIFSVDQSLIPVASGVTISGIVSQLNTPPDSVYTAEYGIVQVGDTLTFLSASSNHYTFYSQSQGMISIQLHISGTPTTPFQNYPCELFIFCTLADCNNTCLVTTNSFGCLVDDFVGTSEVKAAGHFSISPNPAASEINIKVSNKKITAEELVIRDMTGRVICHETLSNILQQETVDINYFENGIYTWHIIDGMKNLHSGKLIVNK